VVVSSVLSNPSNALYGTLLLLAGVPVFLCDIKGDISGLAAPARTDDRLNARVAQIGLADYAPRAYPVEFLTLNRGGRGARVRATVSSFGPILLAKVLELNETQQSVLALVFKYADDQKLPLVDLSDLRATLNYLNGDEGKAAMAEYGGIATATAGVMIRKIVELEQQGADAFFGDPEFDIDDLLRAAPDGRGMVSVLEVADMQDRPKLFSTFMMWMLSELYHTLPEVGDVDKPKLVFFFDEAHLLFDGANETFLDQIELVARLIRSKGVGVYFVTQSPQDVPQKVLAQLGNRVQHALRAFTPDDQKMIQAFLLQNVEKLVLGVVVFVFLLKFTPIFDQSAKESCKNFESTYCGVSDMITLYMSYNEPSIAEADPSFAYDNCNNVPFT